MTLKRLKITSIEKYHLYDDTDENPNVIGCELTVSGKIDFEIANQALQETACRHPMVLARLQGQHWVFPNTKDPVELKKIRWVELSSVEAKPNDDIRRIDPADQCGLRFYYVRNGSDVVLHFRSHHALVDGGGGLQIVSDWILIYHRKFTGNSKPKPRRLDADVLVNRNHLRLFSRQFIGKLWIQPVAVFGATKFLFRRIKALNQGMDRPKDQEPPTDFCRYDQRLPADVVNQLKDKANQSGATVNDLIIQALFLAIKDFRRYHSVHEKAEWQRIVVPISIRDYADRRLPAANRATLVQLDRTDRDFADPKGLLWGIHYELGNIQNWNLTKTFLLLIRCFSFVPGFLKRAAKKDVCRATGLVTNLGAPFERLKLKRINGKLICGNLTIEKVGLTVPLRNKTPVGLAVIRYAGELGFCWHFDPLQISQSNSEQLAEFFQKRIRPDD